MNQTKKQRNRWAHAYLYFGDNDYVFSVYDSINAASNSFKYSDPFYETLEMDASEYLDEDDIKFYRGSGQISRADRQKNIWKKQRDLLEKEECRISINYIKADRLQPVRVLSGGLMDDYEPQQESPLKLASEKIQSSIKKATDEYKEAVSRAKDKLPEMVIDGEGSDLDFDEFMNGWSLYRQKLDQFQNIGLITTTEDFTKGKDISKVYKENGAFLSTYLSAFEDTTAPLQDIYSRLNLFKQILDERNAVTEKKVEIGREGITLSSRNSKLNPESLSSGEKHDFIMFYNLIFNSSENGLVLIDEPEISLHIEWQETYLDKLIAICEMNDLQAIVATHSPNIVSSHYDFMVDKGETHG